MSFSTVFQMVYCLGAIFIKSVTLLQGCETQAWGCFHHFTLFIFEVDRVFFSKNNSLISGE